jgi:hypothetical protein
MYHTDIIARQRVRDALAYRESFFPLDLGSTAVTGAHASVVAGFREHYGLEKRPAKVHEPYQVLGLIEDDLTAAMDVPTSDMFGRSTMPGFPLEGWKEWSTPLATGSPGSARVSDNDRRKRGHPDISRRRPFRSVQRPLLRFSRPTGAY